MEEWQKRIIQVLQAERELHTKEIERFDGENYSSYEFDQHCIAVQRIDLLLKLV